MERNRDRDPSGNQGNGDGPVFLSEQRRVLLRPARRHSPSVTLLGDVVEKSYDNCNWALKQTIGRLAISRECWALERLADSQHTPNLLSRPNPWSMLTDYVEGTTLEQLQPQFVDSNRLAQQANSLLDDLEKSGVAHGDLGHDHWQDMGRESNLIWTIQDTLMVIDFAGAVPSDSSMPILRSISSALAEHDQLLRVKIHHHFPSSETPDFEHTRWPLEIWDLLRFLGKL